MTQLSAFQSMVDELGRQQAMAIADFLESQRKTDLVHLATEDDLNRLIKDGLNALELRLVNDLSRTREDFTKEIVRFRQDISARMS